MESPDPALNGVPGQHRASPGHPPLDRGPRHCPANSADTRPKPLANPRSGASCPPRIVNPHGYSPLPQR